jgi:hypothetical protein
LSYPSPYPVSCATRQRQHRRPEKVKIPARNYTLHLNPNPLLFIPPKGNYLLRENLRSRDKSHPPHLTTAKPSPHAAKCKQSPSTRPIRGFFFVLYGASRKEKTGRHLNSPLLVVFAALRACRAPNHNLNQDSRAPTWRRNRYYRMPPLHRRVCWSSTVRSYLLRLGPRDGHPGYHLREPEAACHRQSP